MNEVNELVALSLSLFPLLGVTRSATSNRASHCVGCRCRTLSALAIYNWSCRLHSWCFLLKSPSTSPGSSRLVTSLATLEVEAEKRASEGERTFSSASPQRSCNFQTCRLPAPSSSLLRASSSRSWFSHSPWRKGLSRRWPNHHHHYFHDSWRNIKARVANGVVRRNGHNGSAWRWPAQPSS